MIQSTGAPLGRFPLVICLAWPPKGSQSVQAALTSGDTFQVLHRLCAASVARSCKAPFESRAVPIRVIILSIPLAARQVSFHVVRVDESSLDKICRFHG